MKTIELNEPWTYRTPQKTIHFGTGQHEVFQYVADAAEAEGAITATLTPDPLDGSIEELAEHLATVDDPKEIERLISNEEGGKTRKGALEVLNDRLADLTGTEDGESD